MPVTSSIAAPAQPALQPHQCMWLAAIDAYARTWPEEEPATALFRSFMAAHPDAASRERIEGHLTGSAWLVSADGERVLLTHHRKLDRWLQLGGHADGDADLAHVALREAEEESGLTGLSVEAAIFDLDRHEIPERGDVAAHWHYDVRYVVGAGGSEDFSISEESHALAWRRIEDLAADAAADESMRRMARKWVARRARTSGD